MARRTEEAVAEPVEEAPAEEVAVEAAAEPEATEAPADEATDEAPAEPARQWRVKTRVQYELDGNEFICGAGEIIDDDAAAQVDPDSIEPLS